MDKVSQPLESRPIEQPDKCMYCFNLSFDEWDGTLCAEHQEIADESE